MSWLPVHGCAMALPKRNHAKYGVRQHGPKPSQMFMALQKNPTLLWIYRSAPIDGGAEAVADFLLAQLEIGVRPHELKPTMTLLRQCQAWMFGRPGAKQPTPDLLLATQVLQQQAEQKAAEESWEKRRAAIVARDEERRRGPVRVQLERQIRKPAAPERETFKPQRLTAAQRMDRAWRRRRYLAVPS